MEAHELITSAYMKEGNRVSYYASAPTVFNVKSSMVTDLKRFDEQENSEKTF